jgi:hypothetical protein
MGHQQEQQGRAQCPDPGAADKKLAIHKDLKEPKDKTVTIDQPCCTFVPHMLAMRQGQELVAKNSAAVAHNVHWTGHPLYNPGGNVIVPPQGQHVIKDLKVQKLPMTIACDIHPWMQAYVGIFDHPYFAVTDEKGNFEIKLAPVGKCRLMIWHEANGYRGGAAGRNGEEITIEGVTTDLGIRGLKP